MNLENFKKKYERRRKNKEYRKDKLKDKFPDISFALYSSLHNSFKEEPKDLNLIFELEWNKKKLRTAHWSSLIRELSEVNTGWPDFIFSAEVKETERPKIRYEISLKIKNAYYDGKFWRKKTLEEILKRYGMINSLKSLHFADYMKVSLTSAGKELFNQSFFSNDSEGYTGTPKIPWRDSIVLEDIPLVLEYYKAVEPLILEDLKNRGLTVTCAVKEGEGESIVRRNFRGKRLVVTKPGDIQKIVEELYAYEFIPDLNYIDSNKPNRIIWDLDPSPYIPYRTLKEFVNEFREWLAENGIHTKLRRTGGQGLHIIANVAYNSVPKNYEPFGRQLKADTKIARIGEVGIIWESLQDFIKLSCFAFCYEKKRKGHGFPVTVEKNNLSHRIWNIYVDWTSAIKDKGVRSLGSIHKSTGRLCIPLETMPEDTINPLEDTFEEIFTAMNNPYVLYEPSLAEISLSAVNEIFSKYSWIPEAYINLGPERFCSKFVWP